MCLCRSTQLYSVITLPFHVTVLILHLSMGILAALVAHAPACLGTWHFRHSADTHLLDLQADFWHLQTFNSTSPSGVASWLIKIGFNPLFSDSSQPLLEGDGRSCSGHSLSAKVWMGIYLSKSLTPVFIHNSPQGRDVTVSSDCITSQGCRWGQSYVCSIILVSASL